MGYQPYTITEGIQTVLPIDTIALYLTGVNDVSGFAVGDEISGDTSGAEAIIAAISDVDEDAGTMTLYLKTVTGTFQAAELLAGGTALVAASGTVTIVDYLKAILTAATQVLTVGGAITPGVHATGTLTSTGVVPIDGDTVTIGATTYTFKTVLTGAANEVLIGNVADAAEALDNLKSAINASAGAGTLYGTGTAANASVRATTNTDTTQVVVARTVGTAANSVATTETSALLEWGAATLAGGVAVETVTIDARVYSFVNELSETSGAAAVADQVLWGGDTATALDNLKLAINAGAGVGTNYSTGTTAHSTVNATTNTDTAQTIAADTAGTGGNSIAVSDGLANGSWGAATLTGGYNNLTVTVKGVALVQGTDFTAETSNDVTATNLEVAIEAITGINASVATNVVTVTAIAEGDIGNTYGLVTSSTAAATVSGATLSGGAEEAEATIGSIDTSAPAQVLDCGGAHHVELINFDSADDCWLSLTATEPSVTMDDGFEKLVHAAGWRTILAPREIKLVSATTKFPKVMYRKYS